MIINKIKQNLFKKICPHFITKFDLVSFFSLLLLLSFMNLDFVFYFSFSILLFNKILRIKYLLINNII